MNKQQYFYKEPGKQIKGPIQLDTLEMGMKLGRLDADTVLSIDGKECWVPYNEVQASGFRAFESSGPTPTDSTVITGYIVGGILILSMVGGVIFAMATSQTKTETSQSPRKLDRETEVGYDVRNMVESAKYCLQSARYLIESNRSVDACSMELKAQMTPGGAQSIAIELQEKKESLNGDQKSFAANLANLEEAETKAHSIGTYSEPIRAFEDYGRWIGFLLELSIEHDTKPSLDLEMKYQKVRESWSLNDIREIYHDKGFKKPE